MLSPKRGSISLRTSRAVVERPHLPDGFVAYARHDTVDVVHHRIAGGPFVVPVLLLARQPVEDRMLIVVLDIGQRVEAWASSCCISYMRARISTIGLQARDVWWGP